jgi:hypothetical protein
MTNQEFCWLQGFFEISGTAVITEKTLYQITARRVHYLAFRSIKILSYSRIPPKNTGVFYRRNKK